MIGNQRFNQPFAVGCIRFFPRYLQHTRGEFAGQPFVLTKLQMFIVWNIFGWRDPTKPGRLFRRVLLTMARKWGKSQFVSGLMIVLAYADHPVERGGEIIAAATKFDQASIVVAGMVRMIEANRQLSKLCDVYKNRDTYKSVVLNGALYRGTIIKPIGSDSKTVDGLNPSAVIIDELHAWHQNRHRGLFEKLTTAGGARLQPLEIIISTNGDEQSTFYHSAITEAKQMLDAVDSGDEINPRLFAVLCLMDEKRPCGCGDGCDRCDGGTLPADDPFDETNWIKSNPDIGTSTPSWEYMREQAAKAKRDPSFLNAFLRYHCNVQVASRMKLVDAETFGKSFGPMIEWPRCDAVCGGFDLGFRDDLAGFVVCGRYRTDDGEIRYQFDSMAFLPDAAGRDLYAEPWHTFIQSGDLVATHGDVLNFTRVENEIVDAAHRTHCNEWRHDKFGAGQMASILTNRHGLTCPEFNQNHSRFNEPLREFVRVLGAGQIVHTGGVLAWCANNAVAKENDRGEIMCDKKMAGDAKIDIFVAAIMAFSGVMVGVNEKPPGYGEYYETNDVRFV